MISLRNARITDAVPNIVAKQPWVKALSAAFGMVSGQLLDYTDTSQAFTGIDSAQESILDALAVYLKVEWYDVTASIEKKREYIKTALTIQKYAGTAYAVRMQASLIYPSSEVEEWFDYGGIPGRYRVVVNVTDTPAEIYTNEEMEKLLGYTKRLSAHLESTQYMTKHGLALGKQIESWLYDTPLCGLPLCGTLWMPSTLGWSDGAGAQLGAQADPYLSYPELTGTLPDISTVGWSENDALRAIMDTGAFAADLAESGEYQTGTLPDSSTLAWSATAGAAATAEVGTFAADSAESGNAASGTIPAATTAGISRESAAQLLAAVDSYAISPAQSGTLRCGATQINNT